MAGNTETTHSFLKTPKGTVDYLPADTKIRDKMFATIIDVFRTHGAVTIDTPTFELKALLTNKYGDDSKLIYDLADQGGELCALRYDLTVSLARFLANNRHIGHLRRYQIGKVFRRDQPVVTKGRLREFYQCDLDFVGPADDTAADAEILCVAHRVLTALDVGPFRITVNDRRLLDALYVLAGVPEQFSQTCSSSIDKLDKLPREEVEKELVTKGVPSSAVAALFELLFPNGTPATYESFQNNQSLQSIECGAAALGHLTAVFALLEDLGVPKSSVSFVPSLARGLSYYTGIIFEAVLQDEAFECGSVLGGGRYDKLVGQLSGTNNDVQCVGFSVGVERLFALKKSQATRTPSLSSSSVLVVQAGNADMLSKRFQVLQRLWSGGVRAETIHKRKIPFLKQCEYAEANEIPYLVILGQSEWERGMVVVRMTSDRSSNEEVPIDKMVQHITEKLHVNAV